MHELSPCIFSNVLFEEYRQHTSQYAILLLSSPCHSYPMWFAGTADSTMPSPIPQHRKPHTFSSEYDTHVDTESPNPLPVRTHQRHDDAGEEVLPIPISAIPRRPDVHAKWGGASPRTLAHLLSAVSSRASPSSTPAPGSRPLSDYDVDSPARQSDYGRDSAFAPLDHSDAELPLESLSGQGTLFEQDCSEPDGGRISPAPSPKANGSARPRLYDTDYVGGSTTYQVESNDDMALRESLQGVWRLWKATRQRQTTGDDESEKERFLRVVQDVIGRG